jgi:hypothetical protein
LSLLVGEGAAVARMIADRKERDYWASELRQWQRAAAKRPERLTPIPPDRLPPVFKHEVRLGAWESRNYLAQLYEAPPFNGTTCQRLSVCRYPVVKEGRWGGGFVWEDVFGWEELQAIKRELGFGAAYAIEVYPADENVVNLANTRHLWIFAEALPVGWSA